MPLPVLGSTSACASWADDPAAFAECVESMVASIRYTGLEYQGEAEYVAAQARWGDYNGDGVADVAYALWGCWNVPSWVNGDDASPEGDAYSNIFYGDGQGGFLDAGVSAGAPFLAWYDATLPEWSTDEQAPWFVGNHPAQTTSAFGASDLSRGGRAGILSPCEGPCSSYSGTREYPGVGLGSGHGSASTALPAPVLSASLPAESYEQLVGDWDGDGMPDALVVDRPGGTATPNEGLHRNALAVARYRPVAIHGPWGGVTRLEYGVTTDAVQDHPRLPRALDVIAAVEDESGRTEFDFSGGLWWGEEARPAGFRDARVSREPGISSVARFVQAPWGRGKVAYRADYRADSTLAALVHYRYAAEAWNTQSWDLEAPFWNPLAHECRVEVGGGWGSPALQSTGVEELVAACEEEGASGAVATDGRYQDVMGWTRGSLGSAVSSGVQASAWSLGGDPTYDPGGIPYDCATAGGCDWAGPGPRGGVSPPPAVGPVLPASGMGTAPPALPPGPAPGFSGAFAAIEGALPSMVIEPSTPTLPLDTGGPTTTTRTLTRAWQHGNNQRLSTALDWRDPSVATDGTITVHAYDSGDRLAGSTLFVEDWTWVRTAVFSDLAGFETPQQVDEAASDGAGGYLSRQESTTLATNGTVLSTTDALLNRTSYSTDACGLVESRVDAAARTESTSHDAGCRRSTWAFEGATGSWTYDAYGRLLTSTLDAGAGSEAATEAWYRDDTLDVVDDRASYLEPRAGVVDGEGGLTLLYLDPWGREFATVRCEDGGAGSSSVSDVLSRHSCNTTTSASVAPIYNLRAWAQDGSPRFASMPYHEGDPVVGTWTWSDELGRTRFIDVPAPDSTPRYARTTRDYTVGEYTVEGPEGIECTTESDTTSSATWCEGVFRGGREFDALGRVLVETDAASEAWTTTYDGLGRPLARSGPAIVTATGALVPTWSWTYDALDRVDVATLPDGTTRDTDYDAVGRPASVTVDGPTMSALTTDAWSRLPYDSATGAALELHVDASGRVTTAWLDGTGRAIATMYPDGTGESWQRDGRGRLTATTSVDGITTSYAYDAADRAIEVVDAEGISSWLEHDATGAVVWARDRDDVVTEHTYAWDGSPLSTTRGSFTLRERSYRDDGRVDVETTGGVTTAYGYDTLGRRDGACVGYEAGGAPECALSLQWTYSDNDLVASETRGPWTTSHAYNALGWLESTSRPDGSSESWSYYPSGKVATYTDGSSLVSEWTYDDLGRALSESLPGKGVVTCSYALAATSGLDDLASRTEPDGGQWDAYTDFQGRVVSALDPEGNETRNVYAGSQLREVDYLDATGAVLAREAYAYDDLGRLSARCGPSDDPACADGGTFDPWTVHGFAYSYTPEGRVQSRQGYLDTVTWAYDADGTLATEMHAGVTTWEYGYAADFPRVEYLRSGDATEYREYARGYYRGLWLEEEEATEAGNPDTVYRQFGDWDAYGTPGSAERWVGGTLQSRHLSGTDPMGRPWWQAIETAGGLVGNIQWSYEGNGALSGVTASWAGSLGYARDPSTGLVNSVNGSAGTVATVASRDAMGRPESILLAGGARIDTEWDQLGRVTYRAASNGLGGTAARAHVYDERGRADYQEAWSNGALVETIDYAYDEPGWLAEEARASSGGTTTVSYGYDLGGNRTSRVEVVDDGSGSPVTTSTWYGMGTGNVLASVDGVALAYNAHGELELDHRGQSLLRDADGAEWGLRLATGQVVHEVTRDAWGRPVTVDPDADPGTPGARLVAWGPTLGGGPVAGVDELGVGVLYAGVDGIDVGRVVAGSSFRAMATDRNGSLLLDGDALLGEPVAFGERAVAAAGSTERRAYAGLEILEGTGYQLPRHRLYDAELGRFASPDPLGLAGGDHLYSYAGNDPVGFVDPSGLTACVTGTSCGPGGMDGALNLQFAGLARPSGAQEAMDEFLARAEFHRGLREYMAGFTVSRPGWDSRPFLGRAADAEMAAESASFMEAESIEQMVYIASRGDSLPSEASAGFGGEGTSAVFRVSRGAGRGPLGGGEAGVFDFGHVLEWMDFGLRRFPWARSETAGGEDEDGGEGDGWVSPRLMSQVSGWFRAADYSASRRVLARQATEFMMRNGPVAGLGDGRASAGSAGLGAGLMGSAASSIQGLEFLGWASSSNPSVLLAGPDHAVSAAVQDLADGMAEAAVQGDPSAGDSVSSAAIVTGGVVGVAIEVLTGEAVFKGAAAGGRVVETTVEPVTEGLARVVASAGVPELPLALRGGEATTHVYLGIRDGEAVYVGITNNVPRRQVEHGARFVLDKLTASPLTRGEARAIEQALIERHAGFENIRNSISASHPYYRQAVDWGEAWLKTQGL